MGAFGIPIQFIVQTIAANVIGNNPDVAIPNTGAWRPPQWNQPALTSITTQAQQPDPVTGLAIPGYTFVFDAILRAEHSQELRHTEHPVQTGANISDHMYPMPARLVLEIGMSDAMDSYSPSNWTGNPSKSVSAYEALLDFQNRRNLLTITTRLRTYSNMVCSNVQAPDNVETLYGLKATVTFEEIFFASATSANSSISFASVDGPNAISSRPQDTQSSSPGVIQPLPVPQSLINQNKVPNPAANVPGAGTWSSNPVSQLPEAWQVATKPTQ